MTINEIGNDSVLKADDNSYLSRKWIAFFAAITVVGICTYLLKDNATSLGIGCGAVCTLYAAYVGGNVMDAKSKIAGIVAKVIVPEEPKHD